MRENQSVLEKIRKAYFRLSLDFDDKMVDFDHTATRRGEFTPYRRRKCSKLQTVPCALLLDKSQIRSRPARLGIESRPLLESQYFLKIDLMLNVRLTLFWDKAWGLYEEVRLYVF